jgi:hypothetical protein
MQTATNTEVKAALGILQAVAEAIRELGEVPSGHLYANLMSKLSLAQFEQVLGFLKGAGLVRESNAHLLTWIGPAALDAPAEVA